MSINPQDMCPGDSKAFPTDIEMERITWYRQCLSYEPSTGTYYIRHEDNLGKVMREWELPRYMTLLIDDQAERKIAEFKQAVVSLWKYHDFHLDQDLNNVLSLREDEP